MTDDISAAHRHTYSWHQLGKLVISYAGLVDFLCFSWVGMNSPLLHAISDMSFGLLFGLVSKYQQSTWQQAAALTIIDFGIIMLNHSNNVLDILGQHSTFLTISQLSHSALLPSPSKTYLLKQSPIWIHYNMFLPQSFKLLLIACSLVTFVVAGAFFHFLFWWNGISLRLLLM